jgi:Zn-dependent peptidase ImmA (M78 family)/transcriptional regulator with XRE-family HTH domain
MAGKEDLGSAIRRARDRAGVTQEELAAGAGFPNPQTVSDIERGVREVKARELQRIARVLHTSYDVLLGARPEPAARVLWRRGTAAVPRAQEAEFLERASRYAMLEEWCDLPPAEPLPDFPFDPATATWATAEGLANRVVRTLDLGSRPATSLVKVLEERFRVKIFYADLPGDESAACVRDGFGAAVLMNANQAPWRRNYNFAHELFHLVTWDGVARAWPEVGSEPAWAERLERYANSFASHLLLPAEELSEQYRARCRDGRVADLDMVELAREFDVSTQALVFRLAFLRLVRQDDADATLARPAFQRLDRRTMAERWVTPLAGLPERYVRLAYLAHAKGRMSLARLAEFLETSVSELISQDLERDLAEEAAAAPA